MIATRATRAGHGERHRGPAVALARGGARPERKRAGPGEQGQDKKKHPAAQSSSLRLPFRSLTTGGLRRVATLSWIDDASLLAPEVGGAHHLGDPLVGRRDQRG